MSYDVRAPHLCVNTHTVTQVLYTSLLRLVHTTSICKESVGRFPTAMIFSPPLLNPPLPAGFLTYPRGMYHIDDFIGQTPTSVPIVYLYSRNLIGRRICCGPRQSVPLRSMRSVQQFCCWCCHIARNIMMQITATWRRKGLLPGIVPRRSPAARCPLPAALLLAAPLSAAPLPRHHRGSRWCTKAEFLERLQILY